MTEVAQIQYRQSGFAGAPGFTTMAWVGADDFAVGPCVAAANGFWDAARTLFPVGWSAQLEPLVAVLDEATGALKRYYTPTVGDRAIHVGTQIAGYGAGVAGACFAWSTPEINWTRRVRGRTFLVPLSSTVWDVDGTITSDVLTFFNTMISSLITGATGFAIYSRPRLGVGGKAAVVTAGRVTDQAAYLSSRRQ